MVLTLMSQINFSQEHQQIVLFIECNQSPEQFVFEFQKKYNNSLLKQCLVVCSYSLQQPWAENCQSLEIVYLLEKKDDAFIIEKFSVQSKLNLFLQKKDIIHTDISFFKKIESEFNQQKTIFTLNEPLFMDPVFIPKPWGQEIWYTGVEKRGVSKIFSSYSNSSIPQPWLFAALPNTLLGEKYSKKNLVLVKILDPLPTEVRGDLYYELHQEKNEVYIVTDISTDVGRIKMGISQKKLDEYKNNDSKLKSDFLDVIEKYESVRRKIDTNEVSNNLFEEEVSLRNAMDEYAGYLNLKVGDIISVPILVPHALQHGVRVIEFQTPTYERLIISFAQKVLTQNHWDTKQAFQLMKMEPPQKTILTQLFEDDIIRIEQVCSFQDFYSVRVILQSLNNFTLKCLDFYQVLFIVKGNGELKMNGKTYCVVSGQCIFIPALCSVNLISKQEMNFLICAPEKF